MLSGLHRARPRAIRMSIALLWLVIFVYSAVARDNSVLTYHGDADRSGNFIVPALTWEKARSVKLDRPFNARVAGRLYAQPLYWRAANLNAAMLLVATEDDIVQAFDATTGKELWRRSVGTPVKSSSLPCYTTLGTTLPVGIATA